MDRLRNDIRAVHKVVNVAGNIICPEECTVLQNPYGAACHIGELTGSYLPLIDAAESELECGTPGKTCDQNTDHQTEAGIVKAQTMVVCGNPVIMVIHMRDVAVMQAVADILEYFNVGICSDGTVLFLHDLTHLAM